MINNPKPKTPVRYVTGRGDSGRSPNAPKSIGGCGGGVVRGGVKSHPKSSTPKFLDIGIVDGVSYPKMRSPSCEMFKSGSNTTEFLKCFLRYRSAIFGSPELWRFSPLKITQLR